jgi:putative ABC transport system substrate-binding protein
MQWFVVPALVPQIVLLLCASTVGTQAASKPPRVGVLCSGCANSTINAFWEELPKLGWREGATILIERKEVGARLDQFPAVAAELVRSKPDLIVATSPQGARAAKDATSEIPIAFFWVADPVGMGLASSLAHPDGNVTGAATLVPGDFNGKIFGIVRDLLPRAKRVAALVNPLNESVKLMYSREASPAAAKLGFRLDTIEVNNSEELSGAVEAAKARGADALYVVTDPIISNPPNRVPDLASQAELPSISLLRIFAQSGGLISYGPDFCALARLGARYVDRILRGAKPAELPIEQPSKYELIINLKTAKSLGIEIPSSLLARADEVIE